EVAEGLGHLADISLLHPEDGVDAERVDVAPLAAGVGVAVHPVDVVLAVEGMPVPRIAEPLAVDRPAVEEQDADVEAARRRPLDPLPVAGEVPGVEAPEVEF